MISDDEAKAMRVAAESDQFGKLFGTLCLGLETEVGNTIEVTKRFTRGLQTLLIAHTIAEKLMRTANADDKTDPPA